MKRFAPLHKGRSDMPITAQLSSARTKTAQRGELKERGKRKRAPLLLGAGAKLDDRTPKRSIVYTNI